METAKEQLVLRAGRGAGGAQESRDEGASQRR